MVEIKMRSMDSRGHVYTSRASDKNQTTNITQYFFFKRDVVKSEHSIFDQTDRT